MFFPVPVILTSVMLMVTPQELVLSLMKTLQRMQDILSLSKTAAASQKMKCEIQIQQNHLDQLESQLQILSLQRGWDHSEPEPVSKWMTAFRFRYRKDSSIAEYLIRLYTRSSIVLLKSYNRWSWEDRSVADLFQKFLDRCTICIRQLQPYL